MQLKRFFFAFIFFLFHCKSLDYYEVLEISKDASQSEIKKAFRKLSILYHPDKNPGDESAAQRFMDINNAHDILSNPQKKQLYDHYGEEGLKHSASEETDIWGHKVHNKGPNAEANIYVTLEDLYNGANKEFNINRNVLCPKCRGTGSKDGKLKVCKHCGGHGVRLESVSMGIGFNVQMQVPCDFCGGKGKLSVGNCNQCRGKKVLPEAKTLHIQIERGMKHGMEIVFERESEQSPDFMPGDVIFKLIQSQHETFKRFGDNLYTDIRISLREAILGFKKDIKHLDGHYARVESNEITQPFQVKILKDEGMPKHHYPSDMGDLHSKFVVSLPKRINDKDKEILRKIFAIKS